MYESPSDGYVFTRLPDGSLEFKGDFEGLYQSDPDPWGQSGGHPRLKEYYALSRNRLAETLAGLEWVTALEIGSGLGYATHLLHQRFGPPQRVEGMDISGTAIMGACRNFPGITFHLGDIAGPPPRPDLQGRWDVVILNQTLWYVLDRLPAVFENALTLLAPHGHLIIQMAFLDNQEYGREIVDGFNGLLRYVLDHHSADFQVVRASYDASSRFAPYHDGLLVLQATR